MQKLSRVIGKIVTALKGSVYVVLDYRGLDDFKFDNFNFKIYIKITLQTISSCDMLYY